MYILVDVANVYPKLVSDKVTYVRYLQISPYIIRKSSIYKPGQFSMKFVPLI